MPHKDGDIGCSRSISDSATLLKSRVLNFDAVEALRSLSKVTACFLKLCRKENTTKDEARKVGGLLNLPNAIERSNPLSKKGLHMIFLSTSSRYAQHGSIEE